MTIRISKLNLLLIVLLLISTAFQLKNVFTTSHVGSYSKADPPSNLTHFDNHIVKVVVDGCTYITIEGYREVAITHAGNCNNPVHQKTITKAIVAAMPIR